MAEKLPTLRLFAGEADLPLIVALINRCAAADQFENATSIEELRADIARPEIDARQDAVVIEDAHQIIGFAAILIFDSASKTETHLWMQVAPEATQNTEHQLLEWFTQRAAAISQERCKPVELIASAGETKTARIAALEAAGFAPVRYFFRMSRSLTKSITRSAFPAGYHSRAITGHEEMPAWVDAVNGSFVDHWHFSPLSVERALHFAQNDPNYRREGDLVAMAPDGEIAGFCQCIIRANENAITHRNEGWIALLGTRREHRKIGLGKAMLLRGLQWLGDLGIDTALLGVDGQSPTGALGLYESVGFQKVHKRIAFTKLINAV